MAVAQIEQLALPLNLSPFLIGVRLNELFLGLGNIELAGINIRRRTSEIYQDIMITVSFRQPGDNAYTAVVFVGDATASADDKMASFFSIFNTIRGTLIVDLTPELERYLYRDAALVVFSEQLDSVSLPDNNRARIVVPDALIAPAATGVASLRSSLGTFTNQTISVLNTSPNNWAAGAPGIAVYDVLTGVWQGYPTCCP